MLVDISLYHLKSCLVLPSLSQLALYHLLYTAKGQLFVWYQLLLVNKTIRILRQYFWHGLL